MHGDHIKAVTQAFRTFLHAHGYITGERVAIDGTKMKANATREMLTVEKIDKRLQHLDEQLEEYLSKLAENDIRDDLADDIEHLDGSAAVDQYLLDKIIALQRQVEELTAHKATVEHSGKTCVSPSDPEASLMKSRDGLIPAYNVQTVVDNANHMIAATEVLTNPDDHAALPVMVKTVQDELGVTPTVILADKGYYTPDLLQQVETTTGATCYVAVPKKKKPIVTFEYDASSDRYTCSAGRPLVLHSKNKRKRGSRADVYRGTQCDGCELRAQCTKSPRGRIVSRYHNQDWRDRFRERMAQPASKAIYNLRKCLIEHTFGTMKLWGGKLPLLLRGRRKVTTEIDLYATSYNLKRLINCTTWDTLDSQLTSHTWKLA